MIENVYCIKLDCLGWKEQNFRLTLGHRQLNNTNFLNEKKYMDHPGKCFEMKSISDWLEIQEYIKSVYNIRITHVLSMKKKEGMILCNICEFISQIEKL